jgi:hypothetical protein
MTLTEIIPTIKNLNRSEKIHLLQIIVYELAQEEKNLIKSNEKYPIYSPLNAFEAGDTLLKLLEEDKENEYMNS